MEESKVFCVRYNNFQTNMTEALKNVMTNNHFNDVTLVCKDGQVKAHQLILSTCSAFLNEILSRNPHPHPLLYLHGLQIDDLRNLVTYMYLGEVNVEKECLNSFLQAASDLEVKGLVQNKNEDLESETISLPNKTWKFHEERMDKKEQKPRDTSYGKTKRTSISNCPEPDEPTPLVIVKSDAKKARLDEDEIEDVKVENEDYDEPGIYLEDNEFDCNNLSKDGLQDYSMDEPPNHLHILDASMEHEYSSKLELQLQLDQTIDHEMTRGDLSTTKSNKDKFEKLKEIAGVYTEDTGVHGKFRCRLCDKVTRNRSHLQEHIEAKHIKVALYSCGTCGNNFSSSASVRHHKKKYHQE